MTIEEKNQIQKIIDTGNFRTKQLLTDLISTAVISEENPQKRTGKQNNSYWLWLELIAKQAQNLGVTADMLFRHTMHVSVTKNMLHGAISSLIKAKWNLDSTTQLDKTGHLDEIQDHVASWVGKENIEIPPFPHEDKNTKLNAVENLKSKEYPEYNGAPTI